VLGFTISSRIFSSGFEIRTSAGIFSARRVPLSPTGQVRILDAEGSQVARLEAANLSSSIYNVIITGGGFYQFGRDGSSSQSWICMGEEKLFRISAQSTRRFLVAEGAQEIAECSKSRFFNDYEVRVFNDADLKLIVCVFIALSLLEHQSTHIPI
jgi:hypothetical protein